MQSKAILPIGMTFVLAVAGGWSLAAQAAPHELLLASSKKDHTLAIVDVASDRVIAKMPIGPDPHEVIASDDGKTAFVSNMGNSSLHRIDVLDLVEHKALEPIDTGPLTGVHGLVFADGKLWFTAQGAMALARLDVATRQVEWIIGTGQSWTHMLVLAPNRERIYATNVLAGTLSIFELQPAPTPIWVHTIVPTERGSEGVDLSPDGQELWTASSASGSIYVIDTAAKKVVQTLDAKVVGANRVKFTHDGRRVLISSLRTGDLSIYDAKARTEIKRVRLGTGCTGTLVAPDDARAYIACSSDNYVVVLDLKRLEPLEHIDVGPQPDGLAWAPSPRL